MTVSAVRSRLSAVLVLTLMLALPLPASVAAGDAPPPATAVGPTIRTPSPAPGSVGNAGPVIIRAMAAGTAPVTDATLSLDGGEPIAMDVVTTDLPGGAAQLSAAVSLTDGLHVAVVEVVDAEGRPTTRTWSFHATDLVVERLAGPGRLETAVAMAAATFPRDGGAPAAVVARADDFADALAGAPLAASVGGPLLLSGRTGLPDVVAAELRRALEPGATVHLLGGLAALGAEVEADLRSLGFMPQRHAGEDRFATAAAVARALPPSSGAVLASGTSFPDALAASVPAARDGVPVLLTTRDTLPTATATALRERRPETITIVGGTGVVGPDVARRAGMLAPDVERLAGPDRFATAAAVLSRFYDRPEAVAIASGETFPDALAGAQHAAASGQPLLLTSRGALPMPTDAAIRGAAPRRLTVYGGASAVAPETAATARRAAVDGAGGVRTLGTTPTAGATVGHLATVTVLFDRPVDPARSSVHVEIAGLEIPGVLRPGAPQPLLTLVLDDAAALLPHDVATEGRIIVAAVTASGEKSHSETAFRSLLPDPHFASTGGIELLLPSRDIELIGFHEANHPGAQQLTPNTTATAMLTLDSRRRAAGSRSAADIVASPDAVILAPATGRVIRASSYVLYCRHADEFLVIAPDARPDWEVKLLHVEGLRVRPGDRVEAGRTIVAERPRTLPFASQVDTSTQARNWPHVHLEVVDPAVPTRPGGGC